MLVLGFDIGAYFLLFHELRIRNIIHDILPEHGCRQDRIYLFRIQIFQLPVEYELIPSFAKVDGDFPAKEDEGEDIAILRSMSALFPCDGSSAVH